MPATKQVKSTASKTCGSLELIKDAYTVPYILSAYIYINNIYIRIIYIFIK